MRDDTDLVAQVLRTSTSNHSEGTALEVVGFCFLCGGQTSSHDSFRVHGATSDGPLVLHRACTLRFTVQLLEQLERTQSGVANDGSMMGVDLSPRELQVLEGIVRGEKDKEIAERLGIAEHTVKNHAYDVRHKIGARSRTEAAVRAIRSGLVVETLSVDAPTP